MKFRPMQCRRAACPPFAFRDGREGSVPACTQPQGVVFTKSVIIYSMLATSRASGKRCKFAACCTDEASANRTGLGIHSKSHYSNAPSYSFASYLTNK